MLRLIGLAVAAGLLGAPCAHATCEPPSPPPQSDRPARPAPPEMPACTTSDSCRHGESSTYNKAVAAFNQRQRTYQDVGQAYVAKLNAYVAAAEAYARCELAELNAIK